MHIWKSGNDRINSIHISSLIFYKIYSTKTGEVPKWNKPLYCNIIIKKLNNIVNKNNNW